MEYKAVYCENCKMFLYQIIDGAYWIGGVVLNHGFSGKCYWCKKEFNSEWVEKNDQR